MNDSFKKIFFNKYKICLFFIIDKGGIGVHVYKFSVSIKFLNNIAQQQCAALLRIINRSVNFSALTCMAQEIRGVYLSNSFNVFFPNSTG